MQLNDDERLLRESVKEFCRMHVTPQISAWASGEGVPDSVLAQLPELGLLGMELDETAGGAGLSRFAAVVALSTLAEADAGLALLVAMHNDFGVELTQTSGTSLVTSDAIVGFAGAPWSACVRGTATEHDGRWSVEACSEGAWLPSQRAFLLAVPGDVAEAKHGAGAGSVALLRVDAVDQGIERRPEREPLAFRSLPRGTVQVRTTLPATHGVRVSAAAFDACVTRAQLSVAAIACGIGRATLAAALRYANEREQFGQPIAAFQAIQWKVADSALELEGAWLLTERAASLGATGALAHAAAVRAKLAATRAAVRAAHDALQIHGGYGYTREFPVERHLRDAKGCELLLGGSSAARLALARDIAARWQARR